MKIWLKSTISILLGIMILVTGSGVSLAKMVCLKSGYIQFSLSEPDDCCPPHEEQTSDVIIDEKCCDISSMNIDILDYLVSATQNIEKSVVIFNIPSTLSVLDCAQTDNAGTIISWFDPGSLESSLPPIRILTKSFLI